MSHVHPVKTALVAAGITQTEFAPTVGVSVNTFRQVVNGHQAAWPSLRQRVSERLQRPESELFPETTTGATRAAAERAAQGLPTTITDADALARVERIAREAS